MNVILFTKQHKTIAILSILIFLVTGCAGELTKADAMKKLTDAYTAGNNSDEAGGSRTIVEGISIDSIHQANDTALVFYRLSGSVENGSKYPKEFDDREHECNFKKTLTGWKIK